MSQALKHFTLFNFKFLDSRIQSKILIPISFIKIADIFVRKFHKRRARPGFEPGTSRIRSANHTPRPTSHACRTIHGQKILYNTIKVVNIIRLARLKPINNKIHNLFHNFNNFFWCSVLFRRWLYSLWLVVASFELSKLVFSWDQKH